MMMQIYPLIFSDFIYICKILMLIVWLNPTDNAHCSNNQSSLQSPHGFLWLKQSLFRVQYNFLFCATFSLMQPPSKETNPCKAVALYQTLSLLPYQHPNFDTKLGCICFCQNNAFSGNSANPKR